MPRPGARPLASGPPGPLSCAPASGRRVASDLVAVSAHAGHSVRGKSPATEAYRDAVAANADYVELDIRRTADGELVAFHDSRTSQGHPLSTVEYARLCD